MKVVEGQLGSTNKRRMNVRGSARGKGNRLITSDIDTLRTLGQGRNSSAGGKSQRLCTALGHTSPSRQTGYFDWRELTTTFR